MSVSAAFAGLELLIQLIDRLSAASALVKNARAQGRDVTSAELATLREQGDALLAGLDDAIARAKAEGR